MRNTSFFWFFQFFGSLGVVGDTEASDDALDGFMLRLSCLGLEFCLIHVSGRRCRAGDPDEPESPNRWDLVIPFPLRDAYVPLNPRLSDRISGLGDAVSPFPPNHLLRS